MQPSQKTQEEIFRLKAFYLKNKNKNKKQAIVWEAFKCSGKMFYSF